ncbi:MAG: undecaprenyl diphosphate synthase [Parcubacteria group bacterium Gr01-1014_48]|nr:MAG: undecaprenyl diphosphate synthase [Parcubacteria group bacterium Greene0416_14]TSC74025.1 MAG: undecaprenyl diphosphate synthase [Parcubacteria group bacterium Gr01-1014_48]TSD00803.1 MAG: undecaprenyl diphosphate synthase [Parcubacteria group bacterium Greene1014_15]TSD07199.1 MAG: undecaprenyl diphosphate synthase [Parcubacteria group bacterium Greene0714_4]
MFGVKDKKGAAIAKTAAAPRCIGIIMDGNRRWAKSHGLPPFEGHRRGYAKLKKLTGWAKEAGIPYIIVYAFSTENWNRTKEEVNYLMDLFRVMMGDLLATATTEKTRVIFIGQRERFAADILKGMRNVEEKTKNFKDLTLGVALSYGGRPEIVSVIRSLSPAEITNLDEETFSKKLWTKDFPDPDMVVRTSGEKRTSGFLPWQSVYSELFFTDTYWPAFSKKEFFSLLAEYALRKRRRGV